MTTLVVAGVLAVLPSGEGPLVREAAEASGAGELAVIVLLDEQHGDVPAEPGNVGRRLDITRNDQRALLDEIGAVRDVKQFSLINGFAATINPEQRDRLARDGRVRAVVPDPPIHRPLPIMEEPNAEAAPRVPAGACPADAGQPLLEPEALRVTKAAFQDPATPSAQQLASGRGVKVAFLADGLDVANPDFIRPDGSRVFTDYRDFTGEGIDKPADGREAFGDASAIAAQGAQTYDLGEVANAAAGLPRGCTIKIRGVAPGASLVALKVISGKGYGTTSSVVQALDYAVNTARVDVINESLGSHPYPDAHTDPFTLANRAAVAAGVTVVASSGDGGVGNTIGNPAGDPQVITVGASTTFGLYAQYLLGGFPGYSGTWRNDNVSSISSAGITAEGRVIDLMAPGDQGWAVCTPKPELYTGCKDSKKRPMPVQPFGGTSQSAPFVAGAAALVIDAYRAAHGSRPTPAQVKRLLTSTATDQRDPAERQGAGLLNVLAAVEAAAGTGNHLLVEQTQLTATADPGMPQDLAVTVTNLGKEPATVTPSTRTLSRRLADERGTTTLDTRDGQSFVDGLGVKRAYTTRTFTVPSGADHLDAAIGFDPASGYPVRLALLDPSGAFSGYSLPQGAAGYGHIDVHDPAPGTWTAVLYGSANASGFHGQVGFQFTSTAYAQSGTVVPGSLRIEPGQSATFHVLASTPRDPGDQSAAVVLESDRGARAVVPVILRALVKAFFKGVLTGGNGRRNAPASASTFAFDVPKGQRDIGVSVTMEREPAQPVFGLLTSPDGQLISTASTVRSVSQDGKPTAYGRTLQNYHRDPVPGRWTYTVLASNPVSGTATEQPYTGSLRFGTVDAALTGDLGTLPAGRPSTVQVRVRNTGAAPLAYFVDARTTEFADLPLVSPRGTTGLPLFPPPQRGYLVPTGTTDLRGTATGTRPVTATLTASNGEPEVHALPGRDGSATATARAGTVSPGSWTLTANALGPNDAQVQGTADLTVIARTRRFDPAVTSSTGNAWLAATDSTPPDFTPLLVQPGATATITITITPAAVPGSTVAGFLAIGTWDEYAEAGDELSAISYSYRVN